MNTLKNMKIWKKLALGFGVIALATLLLGALGSYSTVMSGRALNAIANVHLPAVQSLMLVMEAKKELTTAENAMLSRSMTLETREEAHKTLTESWGQATEALNTYAALPHTPEEKEHWPKFTAAWEVCKKDHEEFVRLAKAFDAAAIQDPAALEKQIYRFRGDHHSLRLSVLDSLETGTPLQGGDDPTVCAFGKWMASFESKNPEIQKNMDGITGSHERFHKAIARFKELTAQGDRAAALSLFHGEMGDAAQSTFGHFDAILAEAARAEELYTQMSNQALIANAASFEEAEKPLDALVGIASKNAATAVDTAEKRARWVQVASFTATALCLILAVVLGMAVSRSIATPLARVVQHLKTMAQGDFSGNVDKNDLQRADEIGEVAQATESLTASMRGIVTDIAGGVQTLASSSTELSAVSTQMSASVQSISERANTVAAAAEESSVNTKSVSGSMEQTTASLTSVATATEEMSATISDIAANSDRARDISSQATQQAKAVASTMQTLGDAAQDIGKVTEAITRISEQTNLLALNATIEAARAGAAGKGFAVVAGEIKELARQTADATEDIKQKIAGIQSSTGGAVGDIERISTVIAQVSQIVETIAAAIEEQSVVTRDVAGNIAQASESVQDASERISQTAAVSQSMAHDIADVYSAIGEVKDGGNQVEARAAELSTLAEQLKAMVGKFAV